MVITPSMVVHDELELIRCAQAGDRAAFDVLANRYRALILAITFLRTGSKDEAEDLTQEILTKAWVNLAALKEPAAFIAWLRTIAANACLDWYRKAPWPESLTDLSEHMKISTPGPDELVVVHDNHSHLRRALLALPDKNRLALLLFVWGSYSYKQIAELLEIPLTTVEGRIYRARQQLERLLITQSEELTGNIRCER